mmetsp:Transcript_91651/g.280443  ORF Transcript_91651/g.280443 Transcript_91651/m.280443 type:complete len:207 (-) Transcript_91651:290-910(-)
MGDTAPAHLQGGCVRGLEIRHRAGGLRAPGLGDQAAHEPDRRRASAGGWQRLVPLGRRRPQDDHRAARKTHVHDAAVGVRPDDRHARGGDSARLDRRALQRLRTQAGGQPSRLHRGDVEVRFEARADVHLLVLGHLPVPRRRQVGNKESHPFQDRRLQPVLRAAAGAPGDVYRGCAAAGGHKTHGRKEDVFLEVRPLELRASARQG